MNLDQVPLPFQGDLVFMKELAIKNFQINSKLQNHLKLVFIEFPGY